ncbi:6-bladed beta-propeller [Parabacteroides faecis]|uniref:6-bladed beta-propeller n=1 Tax=Parabacteroides faecis TaxID=1217282 RepID=UPI0035216216
MIKTVRLYTLCILSLSSIFSCTDNISESEITTIKLTPNKESHLLLSSIIDSLHILPLETTEQALLSNIDKLEYDEGLYFIQNEQDMLIYIFNRNGKFNCKPAKKGQGPGEIRFPQNFALNKMDKEIWLTNNNSFYKYNYAGKYLGNIPYSLGFNDFCIEKSGNIYFYTNKNNNSHIGDGFLTGNITMLSPKGEKKTWFKSKAALERKPNESLMSFFTKTPFSEQEDGKITCHYAFSDTIYSIQGDHINPSYIIDLGENKSKIDLDQISGSDVDKFILAHPQTVWYARNVIETSKIVMFSYSFGFESNADVYYNKSNGHILEGKPINDLLGGNIKILGKKGKSFIGYMPATDIQLSDKLSSFISQEKLSELKKITPESNPILIEFTLKDF